MKEVWKHVPSELGVLASNKGRVLLPPCNKPMPRGGFSLRVTKPTFGKKCTIPGTSYCYCVVLLRDNTAASRRQRPKRVSQLVCEAFNGAKPFPNAVVMHLDDNPLNNVPENLKWGTQKENLAAPSFREKRRRLSSEQQQRARVSRQMAEVYHG